MYWASTCNQTKSNPSYSLPIVLPLLTWTQDHSDEDFGGTILKTKTLPMSGTLGGILFSHLFLENFERAAFLECVPGKAQLFYCLSLVWSCAGAGIKHLCPPGMQWGSGAPCPHPFSAHTVGDEALVAGYRVSSPVQIGQPGGLCQVQFPPISAPDWYLLLILSNVCSDLFCLQLIYAPPGTPIMFHLHGLRHLACFSNKQSLLIPQHHQNGEATTEVGFCPTSSRIHSHWGPYYVLTKYPIQWLHLAPKAPYPKLQAHQQQQPSISGSYCDRALPRNMALSWEMGLVPVSKFAPGGPWGDRLLRPLVWMYSLGDRVLSQQLSGDHLAY